MDDQRFDESIRSKVGEYEAPGFDPVALAALHQKMASVSVVPWYSRYRSELLVGSGIALSTLIILYSQWTMVSNTTETLKEKMNAIQSHQAEISDLQNEISRLKKTTPDTIRIIEIREHPSSHYTSLLYRIRLLESEAANRMAIHKQDSSSENMLALNKQNYSPDTKIVSDRDAYPMAVYRNSFSARLTPRAMERESLRTEPNYETPLTQSASKILSVKALRDLEKHYQKGIGVRVGPTVEFAKGFYTHGEQGDIAFTYGVLGDFRFSPALSLETGIKYSKRYYDVSDDELVNLSLPGVDESLGTLQTAEIDSWMFEIPLTLKYWYPLSLKTHLLGGVGYSSFFFQKQIFEYEYSFNDVGGTYTVVSSYKTDKTTYYPGSINTSLGISKQLKNKKILETSIFYQHGLGEKGVENNNANFLGIRCAYWFTVR